MYNLILTRYGCEDCSRLIRSHSPEAASGSAPEKQRVAELADQCRGLKTELADLQKRHGEAASRVQASHAQVRAHSKLGRVASFQDICGALAGKGGSWMSNFLTSAVRVRYSRVNQDVPLKDYMWHGYDVHVDLVRNIHCLEHVKCWI